MEESHLAFFSPSAFPAFFLSEENSAGDAASKLARCFRAKLPIFFLFRFFLTVNKLPRQEKSLLSFALLSPLFTKCPLKRTFLPFVMSQRAPTSPS